ncbi:PTPc [Nesidiocoris tenuis]|uniref:PTPc n=1 Tax=Nesidiocoris tenuis TaxID=355587 RepID=A0ABN7AZE1_9HEMI|nr:PTPc [Nesidiocoris tenuis]
MFKGLFIIVLLAAVKSSSFVDATGYVGCLFSEELCKASQWCYDDGAFGRCLSQDPDYEEDTYRHQLQSDDLEKLEYELGKLLENGYRWSHRHTQCVLQSLLHSFRTGYDYDSVYCDSLKDKDLESVLNSGGINEEDDNLAYIKYSPNDRYENLAPFQDDEEEEEPESTDYARIIYYAAKDREPDEGVYGIEEDLEYDEPYSLVRRSLPDQWESDHFSTLYNTPNNFRSGFELRDLPVDSILDGPEGDIGEGYTEGGVVSIPSDQGDQMIQDMEDTWLESLGFKRPERLDVKKPGPPYDPAFQQKAVFKEDFNETAKKYDGQKEIISNEIPLQSVKNLSPLNSKFVKKIPDQLADTGEFEEIKATYVHIDFKDGISTWVEGRVILDQIANLLKLPKNIFSEARVDRNEITFKLKEPNKLNLNGSEAVRKIESIRDDLKKNGGHVITRVGYKDKHLIATKSRFVKKMVDELADNNKYDVIDTTYAYIEFRNEIKTWKEGRTIIDKVAELLHVPKDLFIKERVDRNEVTFKVKEPNNFGLNGTEVARKIESIKDDLSRTAGVVVTSTGIGDKSKLPSAERLDVRSDHEIYVVTVIVCGVMAALVLSAGVLYLTRRHGYKLANMTATDTESSKLYQDLCRARMSTKATNGQNGKNGESAGTAPTQRIASLSKESDKDSPSSRSSTSSWSDEPALTNMEITTGKIVLAFMEEHVKNTERLESEWAALCAYEADPCATTIAQMPENAQKNRFTHGLPYDHARVVLNELSNVAESDYINASTITDHDPRTVAYIVTQGPLPHTVPDLWQMVWEQGCVVLVMLTRLGEPDSPLCHRYWPEDGSEVYHIYEVHLVGEYMWCDDYVVRSFYLKNLKTGETRTVTQFHFLSWPEGGVPTSTKSLLEFRRKVNKSFRGRSCPIVVHCSDGVGRSGSYVLMDMVLNRIAKGAKEIDVAATLEHIRDQRAGAVANQKQFEFVLQAVADEVQAILKVLQQQ